MTIDRFFSARRSIVRKYLLTRSSDKWVILWDEVGNTIATISDGSSFLRSAIFSPDGQYICTSDIGSKVYFWDLNGRLIAELVHENHITSLSFSTDGNFLMTTSLDGTVALWDKNGKLLKSYRFESPVLGAHLTSDNQRIMALTREGQMTIREMATHSIEYFEELRGTILSIDISNDDELILTSSTDQTAKLWDARGNLLMDMAHHDSDITQVLIMPDQRSTIFVSKDNFVYTCPTPDSSLKYLASKPNPVLLEASFRMT